MLQNNSNNFFTDDKEDKRPTARGANSTASTTGVINRSASISTEWVIDSIRKSIDSQDDSSDEQENHSWRTQTV